MKLTDHPLYRAASPSERGALDRAALTQSGVWPRSEFAMVVPPPRERARELQRIELSWWARVRRFIRWAFAKPEGGNRR
ncbi:MAG: hypothetical protein HOW73_47780 [Polyangiaceae bacterium]|nr:hypothetical protein [Polyangiaceae bacterium]